MTQSGFSPLIVTNGLCGYVLLQSVRQSVWAIHAGQGTAYTCICSLNTLNRRFACCDINYGEIYCKCKVMILGQRWKSNHIDMQSHLIRTCQFLCTSKYLNCKWLPTKLCLTIAFLGCSCKMIVLAELGSILYLWQIESWAFWPLVLCIFSDSCN